MDFVLVGLTAATSIAGTWLIVVTELGLNPMRRLKAPSLAGGTITLDSDHIGMT